MSKLHFNSYLMIYSLYKIINKWAIVTINKDKESQTNKRNLTQKFSYFLVSMTRLNKCKSAVKYHFNKLNEVNNCLPLADISQILQKSSKKHGCIYLFLILFLPDAISTPTQTGKSKEKALINEIGDFRSTCRDWGTNNCIFI